MSDPRRPTPTTGAAGAAPGQHFIREIIVADRAAGKHGGRVATRFPPEPNGYLHIGHAKSICLNFGMAAEFGGTCNLRFDDSNPLTEDVEYVRSIERDVRWLGFDWQDREYFASDYFERLYACAVRLIELGKAYVDSSSEEEIRAARGTVNEPGRESPYRDRSVEANLDLFRRMRAGEFPDGAHVLRARIDMAAANMKMRDPLLYRIRHTRHYRTGDAWVIYPMYDFTHCLSDWFESITHSLCTLEFENNRELYDWILDAAVPEPHPQQIEFARLNLSYTVLSKRRLLQLVEEGHVAGWDDPRLPTLSGLRRRGYTPAAIRDFCERIGVAKANSVVDVELLEHSLRDDLNRTAPRVLAVLRPLRLVVENFPEDAVEHFDAPDFPDDPGSGGTRRLPFSRLLYVERDDFAESPPRGFHRLAPGREVRLRHAYIVRCTGAVKDAAGEVVEVRCVYDPATRGGAAPDGRRVPGTIHWVSAAHALPAEARLYDRLFRVERPDAGEEEFTVHLNPESLVTLDGCRIEPSVAGAAAGGRFQFERLGYFVLDAVDGAGGRLVFNRTVTLRDSWARAAERAAAERAAPAPVPAPRVERPAAPAAAAVDDPLAGLGPAVRTRAERYRDGMGVGAVEARRLAEDDQAAALFSAAVDAGGSAPAVAKWVVHELGRELKTRRAADLPFDGVALAELASLVDSGAISTTAGKEILGELLARGGSPRALVRERGLEQVSDRDALSPIVERLLTEHADKAAAYREGKTTLLGWFVGQAMRRSGGKGNPKLLNDLLRERLGG